MQLCSHGVEVLPEHDNDDLGFYFYIFQNQQENYKGVMT